MNQQTMNMENHISFFDSLLGDYSKVALTHLGKISHDNVMEKVKNIANAK